MAGTHQTVSWTSFNVPGDVTIKLSIDGASTFPVELALNTANDGSETVTVPSARSTECRVRVESVSNTLIYGDNPGDFTIAVETAGPVIGQPTVTGGIAGQELTVGSLVTDNSGVADVTLYYRRGGEAPFASASMTGVGDTYQATVPPSGVTERGVDYYIKAIDIFANESWSAGKGAWHSVQVVVPGEGVARGAAQPAGSAQTAYRMVSIPLQADRNDVGSVLADDLGAYDNTKWRIFELKADQSYGELSATAPMIPGKAFWLITKDEGKVIDTGPGKSISTASPYGIPLHTGWNLVGNPYDYLVPAGKMTLASGDTVILRSYEGSWNNPVSNPVTAIEPFAGYALQASRVTILNVDGDLSTGPLPKAGSPAAALPAAAGAEPAWWLGIKAQCQEAFDIDNVAMVVEGSEREWDRNDLAEPPVIGDYVSVYFVHPEWGEHGGEYCVDARPEADKGEVWEFEVKTARQDQVELTCTGLENVPEDYGVLLVDDAIRVRHDLRTKPVYRFGSRGGGSGRRFALVVGEEDEVQRLLAARAGVPEFYVLLPNFPNPFNPTTSIVYGLPARSHVSIRVYSVLGQEVAVLLDGVAEEGYRMAEFDGRGLSTGTYYVRMTAGAVGGSQTFSAVGKILLLK
jgi:hypothetical protein